MRKTFFKNYSEKKIIPNNDRKPYNAGRSFGAHAVVSSFSTQLKGFFFKNIVSYYLATHFIHTFRIFPSRVLLISNIVNARFSPMPFWNVYVKYCNFSNLWNRMPHKCFLNCFLTMACWKIVLHEERPIVWRKDLRVRFFSFLIVFSL